jgi:hypothetical protein
MIAEEPESLLKVEREMEARGRLSALEVALEVLNRISDTKGSQV